MIDLRTLMPFDKQAILDSVEKTSRALIVHEDVRTLGIGAELSAVIMEERFDALDAPVMRVTYPDTHTRSRMCSSRPTCRMSRRSRTPCAGSRRTSQPWTQRSRPGRSSSRRYLNEKPSARLWRVRRVGRTGAGASAISPSSTSAQMRAPA